ncbi:hypothetical protein NL676_002368 [Syzygium grande]|nr:hypothetical protein NL676_002368 [Syzygium grande]
MSGPNSNNSAASSSLPPSQILPDRRPPPPLPHQCRPGVPIPRRPVRSGGVIDPSSTRSSRARGGSTPIVSTPQIRPRPGSGPAPGRSSQ